MPDDYTIQGNLKMGGGKPPELMLNYRGVDDTDVMGRIENTGRGFLDVFRDLEAHWNGGQQKPQASAMQQAVQNVQQGMPGAQVVNQQPAPPSNGRPGDGELHPTKKCPDCGAAYKVVDRMKKDGSKRFRKLECSQNYKHTSDFSENYK